MSSPSLRSFMNALVAHEAQLATPYPELNRYRWRADGMNGPALWHELRTSPARAETCKQTDLIRLATIVAVDSGDDLLDANEQLEEFVDVLRELYDSTLHPDVSDPLGAHAARRLKLERAGAVHVPAGVIGAIFVHEIELVRLITP